MFKYFKPLCQIVGKNDVCISRLVSSKVDKYAMMAAVVQCERWPTGSRTYWVGSTLRVALVCDLNCQIAADLAFQALA